MKAQSRTHLLNARRANNLGTLLKTIKGTAVEIEIHDLKKNRFLEDFCLDRTDPAFNTCIQEIDQGRCNKIPIPRNLKLDYVGMYSTEYELTLLFVTKEKDVHTMA